MPDKKYVVGQMLCCKGVPKDCTDEERQKHFDHSVESLKRAFLESPKDHSTVILMVIAD